MEWRHETVPLASGNLQGLGRAMVTVMRRCHTGMAWGHHHLHHGSGVLFLLVGRADAQPGGTKGSNGSSLESGAAKAHGNQELLLLLEVSATLPRSEQVGAGPGASWDASVQPKQNSGRGTSCLPVKPHTLLAPEGHLQAAACLQSPSPRRPPALPRVMAPSSPRSPPAAAHSAPAAFTLFPFEAPGDVSRRCHPLHVRSAIMEIAASR